MLRVLSQKYSLRACGIADDPEHARALRLELPDAEIFCARKEDIPWRDQAFDAVFYQMKKNAPAFDGTFLREAARVLKPGGQLLIAVQGAPEPLCKVGELLGLCDGDDHVSPAQLLKSMEDAGLEAVSYTHLDVYKRQGGRAVRAAHGAVRGLLRGAHPQGRLNDSTER